MLSSGPLTFRMDGCKAETVGDAGLDCARSADLLELAAAGLTRISGWRDAGSLPVLTLPSRTDDLDDLAPLVGRYRATFDEVVVLGIGGSSLGGETICRLAGDGTERPKIGPRVRFLKNIDPASFDAFFQTTDLSRTGFLAISKSGGTAEPLVQLFAALGHLQAAGLDPAAHITAISEATDNPIRRIAAKYGIACLDHDPNVGGRYSALSLVGCLPAMIAGLDVRALRRGALSVLDANLSAGSANAAPAALGAVLNVGLDRDKGVNQTVLMPYLDGLDRLGPWFRQLWAESLGKNGQGTTPVVALGAVDQHSQLQLYLDGRNERLFTVILGEVVNTGPTVPEIITTIAGDGLGYLAGRTMGDLLDAEQRATVDTLIAKGRPTRVISIDRLNEESLGGLMMHFFLETMVAAHLWGVDAFNQPAVEDGKILARRTLLESAGSP